MKNVLILFAIFWGSIVSAAPLMHPSNLDFEEGMKGAMPRGWLLPDYAISRNYSAQLTAENVKSGKYCLELTRTETYKDSIYGSVMQSIDAKPYRGKNIKFGAWVRAEIYGPSGSAHLWVIEYVKGADIRFYDMMDNNPIVMNTWGYYEINADIAEDAEYINFGLMLKGSGRAWIDGSSFEILNENDQTGITPAKTLSEREISNLDAFAKLYGYARYFCPSSESETLDWEKFAFTGVSQVISSKNDNELRDKLVAVFKNIAPAIKIYDSKLPPEEYYFTSTPKDALKDVALAMLHVGSPTIPPNKLSYSKRVNVYQSLRQTEGAVVQLIDASAYSGKKVIFKVMAKAELNQPNGRAEIRILPEIEYKKRNPSELVHLVEIKDNKWTEYSIEATLPENTKGLRLGLVLSGDGIVYFDNASLVIEGLAIENKNELRNPDFEEDPAGKLSRGWRFIPASENAGYTAEVTSLEKKNGTKCLMIASEKNSVIKLPMPGQMFLGQLNDKIGVAVPLCLYTDETGTLPKADNADEYINKINLLKLPNSKDMFRRISILVEAWNNLKFFNSYNRNLKTWNNLLGSLILKAGKDKNELEFLTTLELLVKELNDSQARVWRTGANFYYGLPFLMKWNGSNLIVTQVHESCKELNKGDIITSINGTDTKKYLDSLGNYISSSNEPRKYLKAIAIIRAGIESTSVRMSIKHKDESITQHDFKRNLFLSDLTEERLPDASMVKDGIFYVDLTRMTDRGFFELLDTLGRAKGIILDLRGSTSISEHILSFFIQEPIKVTGWKIPVFTIPNEPPEFSKPISVEIKSRGNLAQANVVFLIDERTIGFSEAIASMARDYGIGRLIGNPTAGTAGEISSFSLGNNYGFSWTTIKAVDKSGKEIYGQGIKPTVVNNMVTDKDETLLLGFEILNY